MWWYQNLRPSTAISNFLPNLDLALLANGTLRAGNSIIILIPSDHSAANPKYWHISDGFDMVKSLLWLMNELCQAYKINLLEYKYIIYFFWTGQLFTSLF